MKKALIVTAVVAGIGILGLQQASANWGQGGFGPGFCGGPESGYTQGGPGFSQLSAEDQAKADNFLEETQGLRKEILMKQSERLALMQSDNPDPDRAAKLAGDIFDLRTTIQDKAEGAGVTRNNDNFSGGPGRGYMHNGRGYGY